MDILSLSVFDVEGDLDIRFEGLRLLEPRPLSLSVVGFVLLLQVDPFEVLNHLSLVLLDFVLIRLDQSVDDGLLRVLVLVQLPNLGKGLVLLVGVPVL